MLAEEKKNADKSQKSKNSNARKMTRLGTHEANTNYGTDIMSLPANEDLRAASSTREESKNIKKAEEQNQTNNEESAQKISSEDKGQSLTKTSDNPMNMLLNIDSEKKPLEG